MTDEQLIEKAAKAMADAERASDDVSWPMLARAALAVFAEAHAPTNDEREALARALFIASENFAFADRMAKAWDAPGPHGRVRWYNYADAVLAAGFRRPVSPETSVGCNICGESLPDGEPHLCAVPSACSNPKCPLDRAHSGHCAPKGWVPARDLDEAVQAGRCETEGQVER